MSYKIGSLFDGSGGFPLAGAMCGFVPTWAAEVEPYPIAVTRSRFPNMRHLGDVSKINGADIEPVDIICGGSPCQDLSVAGKRCGLKHIENGDEETTRSGLFMEMVRIIKEMRNETNGEYPTFVIWENVPGAFSSNNGNDFRLVLEEFIKIAEPQAVMPAVPKGGWAYADCYCGDGWSLAYRVFDAQYWGVPQRRRRIHLVLDLRGERAGKILFEREGLRGGFTEGRTPWQENTADAPGSTGRSSSVRCLNPWDCQSKRIYQPDGVYPTIPAMDCGGRNNQAVCYPINEQIALRYKKLGEKTGFGIGENGAPAFTILANHPHAVCFKSGNGAKARSLGLSERVSPTLNSEAGGNAVPSVCFDARGNGGGMHRPTLTGDHENCVTDYTAITAYRNPKFGEYAALDEENTHTLQAKASGGQSLNCTPSVLMDGRPPRKYIIRRLTTTECARLQGFPDGWGHIVKKQSFTSDEYKFWLNVRNIHAAINGKTVKDYTEAQMVKWYNKLHTDSAEYKMWGNGIALPPALYCMQGIQDALERMETK